MASILIIDDDPAIRQSLTEVLRDEGHDIAEATNGAEALTLLNGGLRPGVIILDLMMPVMDGFTFRERQQADAGLSDIPVIVFTAGLLDERARSLAASAYFTKPFDLGAMLEAIERAA